MEESAAVALAASLPQTADERPPSAVVVQGPHRQAWELSGLAAGRRLAAGAGGARPGRAGRARPTGSGLDDAGLAKLVTQALGAQTSEPRRIGLATALFPPLPRDARPHRRPRGSRSCSSRAGCWSRASDRAARCARGAELDGWRG